MKQNVITEVVDHDLCSGCGVCAGICPSKNLSMDKQANGDLAPHLVGECPPKCFLCLQACPFAENELDVTELARQRFGDPEIKAQEAVGLYLTNFAGYSKEHRATSASGGMTTWLLGTLLREGHVDSVFAASNSHFDGDESLFHMYEMTTPAELRAASGSFYYPIPVDTVLRRIQDLKGSKRFAIVGLPCRLKGIALAMMKIPALRESIPFMFGLVCGHLPNFFYTEYLTQLGGISPDDVKTVQYRGKNPTAPVNNFYFQGKTRNGDSSTRVPFFGKAATAWTSRQFQFNACNFCDDLFAEVADASFMDAWLPEYMKDYRGNSIVTVRNPEIRSIIQKGILAGECELKEITVERVVRSQEGPWQAKSLRLRAQLELAMQQKYRIPSTRQIDSVGDYRGVQLEIAVQNWLQKRSKELWPYYKGRSLFGFHLHLLPGTFMYRMLTIYKRLLRNIGNPSRVLAKLRRVK